MKVYIDCGFHLGEGAMKHVEKWGLDSNTRIIGFEANPNTFNELRKIIVKGNISDQKYDFMARDNFELHNKAVWNSNGFVKMYCGKINVGAELETNSEYIKFMELHDNKLKSGDLITNHQGRAEAIDGSSTIFGKRNSKFFLKKGNITQKNLDFSETVEVASIDFSDFLISNFSAGDEVSVKMDIEGAEFKVLKHLISTDAIKLITRIDVEWHDFGNFGLRLQKLYLKSRIKARSVEISEWE